MPTNSAEGQGKFCEAFPGMKFSVALDHGTQGEVVGSDLDDACAEWQAK